ncbi:MAG TPA: ferredoxin reductase [Solirubrobacteraceae bacterium]|jgi:ferredoxin-NADP reductase|nr:ferredoxin reductase [Solirubrobacteraceae bacterium]
MPERGARPNIHPIQRRVLDALAALSSPLLIDDYLELINPLWSTRELRGRIESIDHETRDAATVLIKPGYRWGGHEPGQYLRIGLDIEGVRHWRAYSLTSDPQREDGLISITVKNVDDGKVSPYLVRRGRPGTIVSLGGVEGEFLLPDPLPAKLLFISAGSGITPIMSMLRHLNQTGELDDAVLLHSARHTDEVIFGDELRGLARRHERVVLHEQLTADNGRMGPADLDRLCPDWRQRDAFISGPNEMLDDFSSHYEQAEVTERLHLERFQPKLGLGEGEEGEGGAIAFLVSDTTGRSDGSQPILVAGEEAGLDLPYGCREGICHTCVGELRSGRVRDLRNGKVHGEEGDVIRTCIHAPEGPIEIEL